MKNKSTHHVFCVHFDSIVWCVGVYCMPSKIIIILTVEKILYKIYFFRKQKKSFPPNGYHHHQNHHIVHFFLIEDNMNMKFNTKHNHHVNEFE